MTTLGILMGSLSGFCFAFLSIFNRRAVQQLSAVRIALYENFFAFLLLLPWLQMRVSMLTFGHIRLLIILGVLCTALAHWLFIESLKRLRTQIASLIAALEPVYGILIALLILREVPEPRTLLGGLIIIFAALFISITY
jgi:drug/metabolite transporter (DMT)-like permease